MQRDELLSHLATELLSRKPTDRPLKVAIDGRCAAGKTTFADELGQAIRREQPEIAVVRPSVDGFHHPREYRYRQGENSARGYYEDAFDCDRIVRLLLAPLSGPEFPVECHEAAHDWRMDRPLAAPVTLVGAGAILLFEGLFLFRGPLDPHWDVRILLDVDAATSIERAVLRDAGENDIENVRAKYEVRYEPAWQIYEAAEDPQSKADIVIDHRDFAAPRQIRP